MSTATIRSRLAWLVGAHLALAAAPLLSLLFTPEMHLMILMWATFAVPVGSLMALSFWVGMGRRRLVQRVFVGLAGSAYVALWLFVLEVVLKIGAPGQQLDSGIVRYLQLSIPYVVIVVLFGGMFMIMRRRWSLEAQTAAHAPTPDGGLRFSVLNLLVISSSLAVVLTLIQASRGESKTLMNVTTTWQTVSSNVLGFGIYFINTACAAHATLRPGNVRRNILLVLLVSTLLGVAISFATRQDLFGWTFVAGGALISVIPTAVVMITMLVVRSCGYRLVRQPTPAADHA